MSRTLVIAVLSAAWLAAGCGDSPHDPDPEPEPNPQLDPAGFRIISGMGTVFEWWETDPLEADTLELTWNQPINARFLLIDAQGDSIDGSAVTHVVVTTPDQRFATYTPTTDPLRGTFGTGSFPEVETSFRVRILAGTTVAASTPDLVLVVSLP